MRSTALDVWSAVARHRFGCLDVRIESRGRQRPNGIDPPHSTGFLARGQHLKIVEDTKLISLETIDRLHLSACGGALEPGGRTPAVLVRDPHQPVPHRILMNVIETGKIGTFIG